MTAWLTGVATAAALAWLIMLALPWQPWRMRETFEADAADTHHNLDDVTVLIPARDESQTLGAVLDGLTSQGHNLSVIVADDQSSDDTARIAHEHPAAPTVVEVPPLPDGWTGKLWALEHAWQQTASPWLVLLDADIQLAPGTLAGLRDKARRDNRTLVSLMAHLRMQAPVEKLLIPAFIYFFKLLYPFALSNAGSRYVTASAGGCVLINAAAVERIGGFGALAGAIIDDCTLAAKVRAAGGRTWLGVTRAAVSLRGYDDFAGIRDMVARSAFSQLGYSTPLLLAATAAMLALFIAPIAGVFTPDPAARAAGVIGYMAMVASFLPTLAYYRQSLARALQLPAVGCMYLAMTWVSAIRYWRGRRSAWRGRIYKR
ncbi:glycosyltransferase [Salinisphaera orenii]|uniref:glycosyltransferase n=1 Tax=Salinisphaera orenii TaxID=856731 RepID=UPI000DBE4A41